MAPFVETAVNKITGVETPRTYTDGRKTRMWEIKPASISTPRETPRSMTNFSSFKIVSTVCPSSRVDFDPGGQYLYRYTGPNSCVEMEGFTPPTVPEWMVDESLQKALLKLRDGKVDLGVALAETRATADMINKTVGRISRQVRHYRRKNPKRIWDNIRKGEHVPNSWLELQYGWTPLLSDIVGSAAAVEAAEEEIPNYIRVVGSVRDVVPINTPDHTSGNTWWPGWVGSANRQSSVVLYYAADDVVLATMNQLGVVTPEIGMWELTRYSFIIDWFLPIGDWLQARSADYGWRFLRGCSTQFATFSAGNSSTTRSWRNGSNKLDARLLERARAEGHRFYRTTFVRSPTPSVLLKNPLDAFGNVKRALNASALLSQAFRLNPR